MGLNFMGDQDSGFLLILLNYLVLDEYKLEIKIFANVVVWNFFLSIFVCLHPCIEYAMLIKNFP